MSEPDDLGAEAPDFPLLYSSANSRFQQVLRAFAPEGSDVAERLRVVLDRDDIPCPNFSELSTGSVTASVADAFLISEIAKKPLSAFFPHPSFIAGAIQADSDTIAQGLAMSAASGDDIAYAELSKQHSDLAARARILTSSLIACAVFALISIPIAGTAVLQLNERAETAESAIVVASGEIEVSGERWIDVGREQLATGLMADALESFNQALSAAETRVMLDPDDLGALYDLAQAEFWVGERNRQHVGPQAAQVHFERYAQIAANLAARAPSDPIYAVREPGFAALNLGILDYHNDRLDRAAERFERSRELLEYAVEAEVTDAAQVANAISWQASVLRAQGRFADSAALRGEQLALYPQIGDAPLDTDRARLFAAQQQAEALLAAGRNVEAEPIAENALIEAEHLLRRDPDNLQNRRRYIRLMVQRVYIHLANNRPFRAKLLIDSAVETERQGQVAGNRSTPSIDFAILQMAQAEVYLAGGDLNSAASAASIALDDMRQGSNTDLNGSLRAARAEEIIGITQLAAGDEVSAERSWRRAADILDPDAQSAAAVALAARIAQRLGETTTAASLRQQLADTDYAAYSDATFWAAVERGRTSQLIQGGQDE